MSPDNMSALSEIGAAAAGSYSLHSTKIVMVLPSRGIPMSRLKNAPTGVVELMLYVYRRGGSSAASFDDDLIRRAVANGWMELISIGVEQSTLVLTPAGRRFVHSCRPPTPLDLRCVCLPTTVPHK
jgi:hypothetical protein